MANKFAQTRSFFVQEIRRVLNPSTDDGEAGGGGPEKGKKTQGWK